MKKALSQQRPFRPSVPEVTCEDFKYHDQKGRADICKCAKTRSKFVRNLRIQNLYAGKLS